MLLRRVGLTASAGLSCLFWPHENECNDGTGNHCVFTSTKVIYLLTL